MAKRASLLLLICVLARAAIGSEQAAPPRGPTARRELERIKREAREATVQRDREAGTLQVRWVNKVGATATEGAEAQRGVANVRFVASPYCRSRFRIERLELVIDMASVEKFRNSMLRLPGAKVAELRAVVVKQFKGRGNEPYVIIGRKEKKELSLSFRINYATWPRQGYRMSGTFDGEELPLPKFWDYVELRCGEEK